MFRKNLKLLPYDTISYNFKEFMPDYEKILQESQKKMTEYYLKVIKDTEEKFKNSGGEIKGTAIYPKEKKHGVKEILDAAKTWGIKVQLDLPIERVDFDVKTPLLLHDTPVAHVNQKFPPLSFDMPVIHPFFDKKEVPKLTRWGKLKAWFKRKHKPLSHSEIDHGPCGFLGKMGFNEVLENLHTREVKHALNAQLIMAGISPESIDEILEKQAIEKGEPFVRKANHEENRFKLTWTQKQVEWFIRKKKAVKKGLSQLWKAIRG